MLKACNVIVKVTEACNLNCKYCYEHKTGDSMSIDDFRKYITLAMEMIPESELVTIVFHGGEPMLLGLDFYEEAVPFLYALGRRLDRKIKIGMQSNGTTCSYSDLEFFVRNGVSIGLSLDGPDALNRLSRGVGVSAVAQSIVSLKALGESVGVIVTVSQFNMAHLAEVYLYLCELGVDDAKFSPVEDLDNGTGITSKEYSDAMVELFKFYVQKRRHTNISTFSDITLGLLSNVLTACHTKTNCGKYVFTIDPSGMIYACGRAQENEFCYGQLGDPDLRIEDSVVYRELMGRVAKLDRSCKYFTKCHGGCFYSAHMHFNDVDACEYFCKYELFSCIDEFLKGAGR